MNYKKVVHSARFSWKMCDFAAQLKHVASKEKFVDIQWDNIIARAFLKLSKKARYRQAGLSWPAKDAADRRLQESQHLLWYHWIEFWNIQDEDVAEQTVRHTPPFLLFLPLYTKIKNENAAKTFNFKERLVNAKLKDIDAYASEHMSTNWVTERTKILHHSA